MLRYGVPWDLVFGLTPYIRSGRVRSVDEFTAAVVSRIHLGPRIISCIEPGRRPAVLTGSESLPANGDLDSPPGGGDPANQRTNLNSELKQ